MEAFVKELQGQLEEELKKAEPIEGTIKKYDFRVKTTRKGINSLKQYFEGRPFPDKTAEVYYFKHIAPSFYSQHFYYVMLYNAELTRLISQKEDFQRFLENELKKTDEFFREYSDFCRYFFSGNDSLDDKYFLPGSPGIGPDYISVVTDDNLCAGSYRASWILANDRYREYLNEQLKSPGHPTEFTEADKLSKNISKSDMVEFACGLSATYAIPLVEVIAKAELFFGVVLKDYSQVDNNNRKRKKGSTPFLHKLIENYNRRAEQLLD